MKILAAVTLLLLVVGVRAGDPGNSSVLSYPDTCDYTEERRAMCGDQCISSYGCYCGSDTINPHYDDDHCCGESCTFDSVWGGVCRQGRKLSKSSPCNTKMRCYNSYQHSQYISGKSHYTCPDSCVPWQSMCRGVSHCEGDTQECGPHLRCPPRYHDGNYIWHNVKRHNISSSLVPGHHYCVGVDVWDDQINDGKFDTIDRSDETLVRATQSPLDLNITSFTRCTSYNDPGVMCGTECRVSGDWCRDDLTDICNTGSGNISTNNSSLCQQPQVWADLPCSQYYDDGRVWRYGLRCSGQKMRCVYPWYTWDDGDTRGSVTQCPDKSDQVFNSSLTCREHLQFHFDFHTQNFCNENYTIWNNTVERRTDIQSDLICTNKTKWLSKIKDSSFSDPHSCQSSCSSPGPDCQTSSVTATLSV